MWRVDPGVGAKSMTPLKWRNRRRCIQGADRRQRSLTGHRSYRRLKCPPGSGRLLSARTASGRLGMIGVQGAIGDLSEPCSVAIDEENGVQAGGTSTSRFERSLLAAGRHTGQDG